MNKIQAMELASGLTRLITGMEDELLQNIAAYLLAGKVDSSTSKWKIRKLAELGKLHQKNIETITSYAKEQRELAELTVKLAAVDAMQHTERGFRKAVIAGLVTDAAEGSMEETMGAIVGTLMKQAKNDLNIVNTTMLYKARDAAGKAVRDAAQLANKQEFVDMLNKAAGQVVTNTETMTAAVSKCLKDMANKGIPAFVDRGGREWSPEAYVGLCVRQTAMNTGTTALFERMKDYHTHFIEISSHLGARPKCSRDQGRIFDLDNTSGETEDGTGRKIQYSAWSSSSYGQPDGILGINCRHSAYPFTPGVNIQRYFPYDQEENDKRYKEIQKQRELERNVRAAKRECAMLKNGDPEEFKKASVRLKERTAQLKQYCTDHDLTYMNERTSVLGYGHSEASKVTAAYRKTLQNEQLTLDNITKGSIINGKGMPDYDVAITQHAIDSVPLVEVEGFDEARNLKLQQAQKDILTEAAKYPVGTEVGAIYRADTMAQIGTNYSVGTPGGGSVQIPSANTSYVAIHNHPDRATLSPKDVRRLLADPNMHSIVATGNDASVYILQPLENCDIVEYSRYLDDALDNLSVFGYSYKDIRDDKVDFSIINADDFYREYSEAIENIWKASENYGFKYTQIQNDKGTKG